MREILFRGKRTDNGEWVVSDTFYQCDGKIKLWDEPNRDGYVEVEKDTIGQYTGLCDKNGNMIFEGEVVQFEDNNYVVRRECDTPGGYWAETGYILDHIGWNDYRHFTDTIDEGNNEICVEIIGNIHDNPELLKGGVQE